jgi:TRAP-type uncharacterized transport system substrate-binding protein
MSIELLEHMVRNRVRMFLRHTWLVTILGTIVVVAVIVAGVYYTTEATVMRIAAGPADSANAKLVGVLSKVLAQAHDRLDLQLVATDGAKGSAQALTGGKADLAIVPTTVGKSPDWPVLAILRQNVMALIVPAPPAPPPAPATAQASTGAGAPAAKGSSSKAAKSGKSSKGGKSAKGAKTAKTAKAGDSDSDDSDDSDDAGNSDDAGKLKVPQLAGKRIGIVTGNEATSDLLDVVLDHYGVPRDKVQVSQIDPKDVAAAVKNSTVDVLFVAGAATGAAISNVVAAAAQDGKAPTFVEIDQADGIADRDPAFEKVDIDAGSFGGNPPSPSKSLTSLSFAEYLVAKKSFSHSSVGALAKLIYTSRLAIAAQMAGEVKIAAPSTDKDGDVLVHPGALDYLNDNEQSFFDKYGDDIFYGMLIFPVFGSAIAGVAGYLRNDSRTRRLRLLQRVLDLVRKAHAAQTLEAIEQLQVDADNLVIAIIHQSEHEEFDETVRMSFSFALDQLRFAIAARRTAIIDRAALTADARTDGGAGAKAAAA